jgi:hypothetical protein
VLDEIAPAEDEMIFRKTSSSVFISTNIDYVLRNLGVRSLIGRRDDDRPVRRERRARRLRSRPSPTPVSPTALSARSSRWSASADIAAGGSQ